MKPAYYLRVNWAVPYRGTFSILELVPNRLPRGLETLREIVLGVFGADADDLRVTRIDLNAEIDLPVELLRALIRVPRKRKSVHFEALAFSEFRVSRDRDVTGLQFGTGRDCILVYNKILELTRRRIPVEGLPPVLTRFERRYRHQRIPIRYLSQLGELEDLEPFSCLQFIDCSSISTGYKADLFNEVRRRHGLHDAVRLLGIHRNFWRDYSDVIRSVEEIGPRLQASYLGGVRGFLEGHPRQWCLPDETPPRERQ